MQLNIYIPKEKAAVLERLDKMAKRTGRQKNDLVLEALEAFFPKDPPKWETSDMGEFEVPSRTELYEEYFDSKYPRLPER